MNYSKARLLIHSGNTPFTTLRKWWAGSDRCFTAMSSEAYLSCSKLIKFLNNLMNGDLYRNNFGEKTGTLIEEIDLKLK